MTGYASRGGRVMGKGAKGAKGATVFGISPVRRALPVGLGPADLARSAKVAKTYRPRALPGDADREALPRGPRPAGRACRLASPGRARGRGGRVGTVRDRRRR